MLVVVLTIRLTGPFSGTALSQQDRGGHRKSHLVPGSGVPEIPDTYMYMYISRARCHVCSVTMPLKVLGHVH